MGEVESPLEIIGLGWEGENARLRPTPKRASAAQRRASFSLADYSDVDRCRSQSYLCISQHAGLFTFLYNNNAREF